MPDISKSYVSRYIARAKTTNSEAERKNCLYRVGTHIEVIPCDGDDDLTTEQQQTVLDAADNLLEGKVS